MDKIWGFETKKTKTEREREREREREARATERLCERVKCVRVRDRDRGTLRVSFIGVDCLLTAAHSSFSIYLFFSFSFLRFSNPKSYKSISIYSEASVSE